MEVRQANIHTSNPSTAQNVLTSLQSSLLQLPQTPASILPINALPSAAQMCLFPLSIIGQPQIPPLLSQASQDPIILLPVSTLPVPPTHSLDVHCSGTKAKAPQQQLLLNNPQLPVIIKPQATPVATSQFDQEAFGQSVIVLPIGSRENASETQSKLALETKTNENNSVIADSTNSNSLYSWTSRRTKRRKISKISEICSLRETISAANQKLSPALRSQSASLLDSSANKNRTQPTSLNLMTKNPGISQIISSLPPGWEVIGLTGLNNMASSLPDSNFPDFTPLSLPNQLLAPNFLSDSAVKPNLVCVNLNNTSQPVASESLDSAAMNELTCSVKLDDIPCTHVISIKTEHVDDEEAKPDSTSDDHSVKRSTEKVQNSRKLRGNTEDQRTEKSRIGSQCLKNTKSSSEINVLATQNKDEQWTVGDVILATDTTLTKNAAGNCLTVTSSSAPGSSNEQFSDTVILKIPICPSNAKSTIKRKKNTIMELKPKTGSSSLPTDVKINSFHSTPASISDDVKWTVVGLTQSLSTNINPIVQNKPASILSCPPGENLSLPLVGTSTSPLFNTESYQNSNFLNNISSIPAINEHVLQPMINVPTSQVIQLNKEANLETDVIQKNQGTASSNINDWKIVGVTPLGMPAAPVNPFTQLNPFQTFSSLFPMLIPTPTSLSLACMTPSNISPTVSSSVMSLARSVPDNFSPVTSSSNNQNSLDNLHHPLSLLKSNESNHWNLIGMLSGNQASFIEADRLNGLTSSSHDIPSPSTNQKEAIKTYQPATAVQHSVSRQTSKAHLKSSDGEMKTKNKTSGQYLDLDNMKKNTVSSLLRLKRMQKSPNETSHRWKFINYMDIQDRGDISQSKTRSLRSNTGNHTMLSKEKEAPVSFLENLQDKTSDLLSCQSKSDLSLVKEMNLSDMSPVKVEPHSAARKRKLKVPRRMIAADTDYHPFDTSSDSN